MNSKTARSTQSRTHPEDGAGAPAPADGDEVTCFVTGAIMARSEAVRVKIGRGQYVWMRAELCREQSPERYR